MNNKRFVTSLLSFLVFSLCASSCAEGAASLIEKIAIGTAALSMKENALNSPSNAFMSLVRSFEYTSGVKIDSRRASLLWKNLGYPSLNTPSRIENATKKMAWACGVEPPDVVIVKHPSQVVIYQDAVSFVIDSGGAILTFWSEADGISKMSDIRARTLASAAVRSVGGSKEAEKAAKTAAAPGDVFHEKGSAFFHFDGHLLLSPEGKTIPLKTMEESKYVFGLLPAGTISKTVRK